MSKRKAERTELDRLDDLITVFEEEINSEVLNTEISDTSTTNSIDGITDRFNHITPGIEFLNLEQNPTYDYVDKLPDLHIEESDLFLNPKTTLEPKDDDFHSSNDKYSYLDECDIMESRIIRMKYNESEEVYKDLEGAFEDLIYKRLSQAKELRDELVKGLVIETGEYLYPMCRKEEYMLNRIIDKPELFILSTKKLMYRIHEIWINEYDPEVLLGLKLTEELYGVKKFEAVFMRRILVKMFGISLSDYQAGKRSCRILLKGEIMKAVKNEASLMKLKSELASEYVRSGYSIRVVCTYTRKIYLMTHFNSIVAHNTIIDALDDARFNKFKMTDSLREERLALALVISKCMKLLDRKIRTSELQLREVAEAFSVPDPKYFHMPL